MFNSNASRRHAVSVLIALIVFTISSSTQAAKGKAKAKFVPQVWAWVTGDKTGTQVDLLVKATKKTQKIIEKLPLTAKVWQRVEARLPRGYKALVSIAQKRSGADWFALLTSITFQSNAWSMATAMASTNSFIARRITKAITGCC